MPELTNENYLRKIPNDFVLTVLVARRVRELSRGAKPLIETTLRSPVEIAFEEIKQGRVKIKSDNEKERALQQENPLGSNGVNSGLQGL